MHRTAVDYAYAELQAEMLAGRLLPGSPISEAEWARRLDMSVTPVREALRRLEADGLVVRRHHRDVRVRPFTLAEARAVYQLRAVLEPMAALLSLRHVAREEVRQLADLVEEQRRVLAEGRHSELELLNNHFHMTVAALSRNPLLEDELRRLWHMVPIIRAVSWRHDARRRAETVAEHRAVVEALERGDAEAALAASQEHVLRAWARVEESFRPRGDEEQPTRAVPTAELRRILEPYGRLDGGPLFGGE
jgi:DNA-binding GntR family transcriptional regulator